MRTAPIRQVFASLEKTKSPLAYVVYNMENVKQYLHTGTSKSTFGIETGHLSKLENKEGESYLKFPRLVPHIFFKTE